MLTRRNVPLVLVLLASACSAPQESSPSDGAAAGASSAIAGASTVAGAGGTGMTGAGGSAGAATSSGGIAGTLAGASTGGAAGSGVVGGAGSNGSGGGGAGNGGDGSAGIATGGTSGSSSGGASGSATGGVSGSSSGAPAGGAGAGGAGAGGRGTAGAAGKAGAAGTGGAPFGVCNGAAPPRAVSIYVVGDSTASVYASNLYPRMGWGQPLQDLFATQCAVVRDVALSGRSSKSFIDEGAWTPVKNGLASGDVVLIQFGHNDEKSDDPARYTEPQTTFKQYLTTYITDTRAKQATPILLTPINRNSWSGTTLSNTHGAYPAAMLELATSLGVGIIDLTAITKQYFERIGQAATTDLFLVLSPGEFPNYPDGNTDNTHLQEIGARKIGQLFAYDAYRQRLTVASYLKAVPVAP